MMFDVPMYNGARTQLGEGVAPFAIPTIGSDASQQAIQRGASALDETVKSYFKIQDFGAEQRVESEVRTTLSGFNTEFERRASLAPGSSAEALYDSDGSLREGVLQDLADEYTGRIGEIQGGFILPESRMRSDAMRQNVSEGLRLQAYAKASLLEIQRSRQAFEEGLKLDLERKDYQGATNRRIKAYEAGIQSQDATNLGILEDTKNSLFDKFKDMAATYPDLAAEKINRGELDGYFSAAEQEQMMGSLSRQDDSRLTELIEGLATRPKSQSSRQDVVDAFMSGSMYSDEVKFLDVLSKDGHFGDCGPQIDSFIYRVADQVRAGEEGPAFASKKEEVIRLCKKYAKSSEFQQDVLHRMDKFAKRKEEFPMLKVSERMKEMEGAPLYRQADYNNAIGSLHGDAAGAYGKYLDSAHGAGMPAEDKTTWMQKYKKDKVENLQKNLSSKTEIAVRERFEVWYEGEKQGKGKEPSYVLQEDMLQTILRETTGRNDLVVPSRGRLLDKNQQDASEEWVYRDNKRFDEGPKILTDAEKQAVQQKDALRKPITFPVTLSVDTANTDAPAGILLPERMRKRFGDDVSGLAALVPVSSSSRRGRPLPVVGYSKGSAPQLTLAGASKMRVTAYTRMDTNVTIAPASQEMKEFFKREYLQEGEVPPQDYGLVPDNGVESAEPVSAAFPNGDLTMLPPL